MWKAMLAHMLISLILLGLIPWDSALGSIQPPGSMPQEVGFPASSVRPALPEATKQGSHARSYYSRLKKAILARFRPVERNSKINFSEAKKYLDGKTTNEKIFDEQFTRKLRGEYTSRVIPLENAATHPVWRARSWEVQRYEESRKDLARWATREVFEDQLKEFFRGSDKDSAPIKVLSVAQDLSGGETRGRSGSDALTPEQKLARAHRTDLPKGQAEEEKVPTKLKTKVNVVRAQGSLVFSNPIAITSVSGGKDEVNVGMGKDFKKLSLRTTANYGVKDERLDLSVNKKISEQVSLDVGHTAYTGNKRFSSGEKTQEQARVNYSISF